MTTAEGNVTWLFSAIFRSSCQIRVRYYPFDDQVLCSSSAHFNIDIDSRNVISNLLPGRIIEVKSISALQPTKAIYRGVIL